MPKPQLSYFDYVKAAFNWRVLVPGLGNLPLNKWLLVGLGIIGFGNPGFWFLGAAAEFGYLFYLSTNPRFQRIVELTGQEVKQEEWGERIARLTAGLDKASMQRYRRLIDNCQAIVRNSGQLAAGQAADDLRAGGVNQLAWMFLKLLHSRLRINQILEQTSRQEIEKEVKEITARLTKEQESSAIYRSIQGTLEIQQRRLENLVKAEESLRVIDAELDRIDKQVILLHEEASVSSDPDLLSVRLDGVMKSLQGTTEWMVQHNELFGSLEEQSIPKNLIEQATRLPEKE